jgi:hypothetical protein
MLDPSWKKLRKGKGERGAWERIRADTYVEGENRRLPARGVVAGMCRVVGMGAVRRKQESR